MTDNLQVDEGIGGKYAEIIEVSAGVYRSGVEVKNPSIAETVGTLNSAVLSEQRGGIH